MESIIVALITGVLSLVGVVITNTAVREHNGFARRMPVVEEQIKVANHRISDLEKWMEGKRQ